MANGIQSYPPETCDMMAHDSIQMDFVKMETQGEGNYASTAFSDTRDQETDQGLTLSPKIQSSDAWLFDAAGTFSDQDLNALLGPVEFDLVAEEARKNGLELDVLFNDEYRLPEPPPKKRRLTGELLKESLPPFESNGPACPQETVSALPDVDNVTKVFQNPISPRISEQALKPISDTPSSLQQSRIASREVRTPPAAAQPARSLCQSTGLISAAENPIQQPGIPGVQNFVGDQWLHELGTQAFDRFDDDRSFFGDYGSNKESSIQYSPVTEPSCAEQEVSFRGAESSTAPAPIWEADVPMPSVERDLSMTESVARKQPIPRIRKKPTRQIQKTPKFSKLQAVDLALQAELSRLDQKYSSRLSKPSLQNLTGNQQNEASVPERGLSQTTQISTPQHSPSLPLSILCALAAPIQLDSIASCIRKSKALLASREAGFTLQPSLAPPTVPTELENLLNSLEQKFRTDEKFRESTVTWLVTRMASVNGKFWEVQFHSPSDSS
jgi:hypothetical protein